MRTVLIMLAALPLLAADAANFSGRVFDVAGDKQIAGAIVTVSTPEGYISSVVTNKAGEFAFATLPAGEYDFRVTAHNFAIYERQITVSSQRRCQATRHPHARSCKQANGIRYRTPESQHFARRRR